MIQTKQTSTLATSKAYQQAVAILAELGECEDNEDTQAQAARILNEVMTLGLVYARCDLMRRMPMATF